MDSEWLVVLNADGTVLAVGGGAPVEWAGSRLEDRTDVPAEIRRIAAETRRLAEESAQPASQTPTALTPGAPPIRFVVLHALPVRRVATDLRALLDSTVRVMERQSRAIDVNLTLDAEPEVPRTLSLDPEKVAWAISALVGNALRFVRRGTRLRPGGTIRVHACYEPVAAQVILDVQDDGSGIPPSVLSELMQRPPGQLHASGLALSLIHDVVAAHGGVLQIESSTEPDRSGTTVRLTFPCR